MTGLEQQQILRELRSGLMEALGERVERVLLYGSQARGDQREDSDLDVLVVVRSEFDYGDLILRTSALVSELSLRFGMVISRAFVSQERFERENSPFLLNVRREAVAV